MNWSDKCMDSKEILKFKNGEILKFTNGNKCNGKVSKQIRFLKRLFGIKFMKSQKRFLKSFLSNKTHIL